MKGVRWRLQTRVPVCDYDVRDSLNRTFPPMDVDNKIWLVKSSGPTYSWTTLNITLFNLRIEGEVPIQAETVHSTLFFVYRKLLLSIYLTKSLNK